MRETILITALLLVIGIVMFVFKPANFIAGYNTMSPKKKAKFNADALCVFVGWLLMASAVFVFGIGLLKEYTGVSDTMLGILIGLHIVLLLAAGVYANVSKRFRSNQEK